ncbi:MAG: alpha/beta hydrolase [Gammaproteobacteria bacterium]|nr:alpha/beta hydrolase [Gammaproteobacteria bacterium]
MKRLIALCLIPLSCCAFAADESFPWLGSLNAGEGVKESGSRLVELPYGLHAIEPEEPDADELFIGVHGWRSEGYEWVYPLQTINNDTRHMFFFNWDTNDRRCQLEVVEEIKASIQNELVDNSRYSSVSVIGHSLGGVVVAQLADSWDADLPLTIHTVAAPLNALSGEVNEACPSQLPMGKQKNVRFIQWRTRFELDNAFNRMDQNPMVVDIPNSIVVELPETYRERRLGHNWSISYVAEQIADSDSD